VRSATTFLTQFESPDAALALRPGLVDRSIHPAGLNPAGAKQGEDI
jgi:hypothetical protein